MLRRLLTYFGLRAAPSPIRRYAGATATFGVVPVVAYAAWRNREKIASLFRQVTAGQQGATSSTQSTSSTSRGETGQRSATYADQTLS